jgi:Concanavalin A-like lectin/glucanases superfamily/Right handed beta helix region
MGIVSSHKGSADSYAAEIDGLSGGPPLAYWRLGEAGGPKITDRAGARHGTYSGTIGYGAAGLPQNSDNAIDFAAVGQGAVPHDSGLLLPAFTLSFWFKAHSYPVDFARMPVITKDQSGNVDGDFNVTIEDEGSALVQFQVAGGARSLSLTSELTLEVAHHVAIRADATGFDAYLDGQYVGKNTDYTDAWSANTQPLRFADVPWSAIDGDCVLDEVALYDRVLTDAEVFQLAQRQIAPVAVNDAAGVPEGATTAVDVTANDTYVGAKSALTVQIVSQPSGGDSVAVNANKDIAYTAGAVAADTARSFTYRITDPNGTSNTATVNVTVQNVGGPAASNVNCYVESGTDTVVVNSAAALEAAVNAAPPGRNILIAPNTYPGGTITFSSSGPADKKPIVIRPQNGIGTVTFDNPTWTFAAGSSRIVLSKLFFNNACLVVNGTNHRITRCQFRQINSQCITIFTATDTRVDHCDFSGYVLHTTVNKGCVKVDNVSMSNQAVNRTLIDYCHIHDIRQNTNLQQGNLLWFGSGGGPAWKRNTNIIVDHCLIDDIGRWGSGEFIVVKTSGVKFRFCTFSNMAPTEEVPGLPAGRSYNKQYLQQRMGSGMEVRGCWFENMNPAGALKVFDDKNVAGLSPLIIGNRFIGDLSMWIGAGDYIPGGAKPGPGGGYHACVGGLFVGNIMGTGTIQVGQLFSNFTVVEDAQNNVLEANIGTVVPLNHAETSQIGTTAQSFASAVKLEAADVGLAAPDPLCPSGPQS